MAQRGDTFDSEKISAMRESGRITALILDELGAMAQPGIATARLDSYARKRLSELGAESAFLGFEGYPAVLCVSLNAVAVHGVPSGEIIEPGDIVSLDFGVRCRGYCTDAALTLGAGIISPRAEKLVRVTKEALARGIRKAQVGNTAGDIGAAIERYVKQRGFKLLKELVGHGVGKELHEPPIVPNVGTPGMGPELVEGMTIAIEPIVCVGSERIRQNSDGFGYESADGSLTAHFEHSVLITRDGPEILTELPGN